MRDNEHHDACNITSNLSLVFGVAESFRCESKAHDFNSVKIVFCSNQVFFLVWALSAKSHLWRLSCSWWCTFHPIMVQRGQGRTVSLSFLLYFFHLIHSTSLKGKIVYKNMYFGFSRIARVKTRSDVCFERKHLHRWMETEKWNKR